MKITPHGYREIVIAAVVCGGLFTVTWWMIPWLGLVPIGLFLFVVSFFRDPDRTIPAGGHQLVAPADGTVMDIEEVHEESYFDAPCLRIGIFLSVVNVHVNRASLTGTISYQEYQEGNFFNASTRKAIEENESNFIVVESQEVTVGIKQISGAIARRIVSTVKEGETVEKGERIGMIKFGSRTELYVPCQCDPKVKVEEGASVRGGTSVMVEFDSFSRSQHDRNKSD